MHALLPHILGFEYCCSPSLRVAASRRLIRPPAVSTSSSRATTTRRHSSVRPVPTGTHQSLRLCPLFRVLAPSAVGEGSEDSPKQEDRENESRTSQTDRKQRNRATQASPRRGPQWAAEGLPRCNGAIPSLLVAKHIANSIAEAYCELRRGLSHLAQARPFREEGRERHSDSRPDNSDDN